MNELSPKVSSFDRTIRTPIVAAACSLERIEARTNPVVARRRLRVSTAKTQKIAASSTKNVPWSLKLIPSKTGRPSEMPAPKLSNSGRANTSCSTSSANANVAKAEVDVTEPQAQRGDEQPDRHRDERAGEDRQPDRPARRRRERIGDEPPEEGRMGRQRRGGQGADAGQRGLAEGEHAPLAGHDRERQEEDGERRALADHPDPERAEPQWNREQGDRDGERADRGPPPSEGWWWRHLAGPGARPTVDLEAFPPQPRVEEQAAEHDDERHAGPKAGRQDTVVGQEVHGDALDESDDHRAEERERQAGQPADDRGGERGDEQQRELAVAQPENRCQQDPSESRQRRADHPRPRGDHRGVDPRDRGRARRVDGRPGCQPDRRGAAAAR